MYSLAISRAFYRLLQILNIILTQQITPILLRMTQEAGQCSNPRKSKQSKQSTQILLSSRTLSPMVTVTSTS